MSVSMLLNSDENLSARRDRENGRIPINSLLTRTNTEHLSHPHSHSHSHNHPHSHPHNHSHDAPTRPRHHHHVHRQSSMYVNRRSATPLPSISSFAPPEAAMSDPSNLTRTKSVPYVSSSSPPRVGSTANTPRRRWKPWEDQQLMKIVSEQGPHRWNIIAQGFPGRNGRQVRLRWMNHLQPTLDKRVWRPEEDKILMDAHRELGNKWALIATRLHGRTDNSVKNRYKSIARRQMRSANGQPEK